MAKVPSIPEELNSLYPPEWLRHEAKVCGALKRHGKVDIVILFWALVLAPAGGVAFTIAGFQALFQLMAGITLARSAFLGRFTQDFARFVKSCAERAMEVHFQAHMPPELFRHFSDVLAIDSSLVSLPDALAKVYPGSRKKTTPAAVKVNAVYSVLSASAKRIIVAAGTTAESKLLQLGSQDLKGKLLLFDLGYFSYPAFRDIARHKGYFISRMKSNANPKIIADHHEGPGRVRKLVGLKLKQALTGLHREELDVTVKTTFREKRRRRMKGKKNTKTILRKQNLRVVGVRHPETHEFHVYITNVPRAWMTPEEIRISYTARWLVELLFDHLKNECGMKKFPVRKNSHIVEILVYTALIRLAVSHVAMDALCNRILQSARQNGGEALHDAMANAMAMRCSHKRFLKAWNAYGLVLLIEVLRKAGIQWKPEFMDKLLAGAMVDPNVTRDTLGRRLASA